MSKMTRIFSKEVIGRTMLLPIALLSLITSCSSLSGDEETYIHVSVEPLRYVTEAIAGNRFIVHTLTPDGSSPETYQPTPQQIAELGESRMYIRVGSLGFERSLLRKFTCNMPHLHCVEASLGIDTLISHHRSGDNADYADPHTWTSPDGMRIIAANIYAALCRVDTAYRDTYARNFKTLLKRIDRVDRAVHNRLDTLTKRTFLTYHPALTYFARDYGLRTGYLPQHRTIDRTFPVTVRQVVLSGMASRHAWWRRCPASLCADAEALMERFGLADLATRPIEALSGGQWQRTLIARALAGRPDLLLLDEPETHLDADTRTLLYGLLREEAAERAVVMVSHENEKTGDGHGRTVWHMEDGVLTATPVPHL